MADGGVDAEAHRRRAVVAATEAGNRSVVYVLVRWIDSNKIESTGTGFIISSTENRCLVLTCNHCLKDSNGNPFNPNIHRIMIRLSGDVSSELEANQLHGDAIRDLALLEIPKHVPRPSLSFVLSKTEMPVVNNVVVALGFCDPDRDEDENEDDEGEDMREHERKNQGQDEGEDEKKRGEGETEDILVFPEDPGAYDGKITSHPVLRSDHPMFDEIVRADCGLISGCSGGPLFYENRVVGMAKQATNQLDVHVTADTVKAVFQKWLNLGHTDPKSISELIQLL